MDASTQCAIELIKIVEIAKNLHGQVEILKAILALTYAVIGIRIIIKVIVAIVTAIKERLEVVNSRKSGFR